MSAQLPHTQTERADLEKLATELGPYGLKTVLVTREGRLPYLDVLNPLAATEVERIYSQGGSFWWPHAEIIAQCDQLTAAADAIASALRATRPGSRHHQLGM